MSVEWLDKMMISSLCHMLDVTWEEQQGVEVIYQWVQWLQSSALSYLGFDTEIVLSKGDQTCTEDGGDKRACPDNSPPDVTIPRIIRYNDDKRHEAFLHAIHYYMICFTEFPGNSFFHFHRTICTGVIVQVFCYVILTAFKAYCPVIVHAHSGTVFAKCSLVPKVFTSFEQKKERLRYANRNIVI
jgi:E3 ubiquitin-protein ligase RNF14